MTLARQLQNAASEAPERCTFTFVDRHNAEKSFTGQSIWQAARARAAAYRAAGIQPQDRIILVLPTEVEFLTAFFACHICRAIAVPIYPPVRLGKLEEYYQRAANLMRTVDARLVVTRRRIHRLLGEPLRRYQPELGCQFVDDAAVPLDTADEILQCELDDIAVIQFSSGTTTEPKAVPLTHRQILANIDAILDYVKPTADDHIVSWLPLYHDMGLVGGLLAALVGRGAMTLLKPEDFLADPSLWLRTISRRRGTISIAPNFAYELCCERIRPERVAGIDLSHWRLALSGAEPIAIATLERFVGTFAPFGFHREALKPVYGLAEAVLGVTFTPREQTFHATEFDQDSLLTKRIAIKGHGRSIVSVGRAIKAMAIAVPLQRFAGGSDWPHLY